MFIKSLHIISFGGLKNRDIELSSGINLLSGGNEAGKTSAAMFIKFIFYGLNSKSLKNMPSERVRYVNRDTMQAAGFMIIETDSHVSYRLERNLILSDKSTAREKVRIINLSSGETVNSQSPGEYFFGVSEEVFVSTCFVRQSSPMKPNPESIESLSAHSDDSLGDENESIDVKRGVKKLNELRRELCHKNGSGGEINELKEKRAALAAELEKNAERSAEIVSSGISLDDINRRLSELEAARDNYAELFSSLDKIVVKRRLDALEQSKNKLSAVREKLAELDSALPENTEDALDNAERDIRTYDELIVAFDESFSDFEVPHESQNMSDISAQADDDLDEAAALNGDVRTNVALAIAMYVGGVIGLAAFAVMFFFNTDIYSIPLIISFALVTLGSVFVSKCGKSKKLLDEILEKWDALSYDELENAVADKLSSLQSSISEDNAREELHKNADNAKLRFDAAHSYVIALAERLELEHGDSIYDTISSLRSILTEAKKKRNELSLLSEKICGRIDTLSELTDGIDAVEAEKEAVAALSTDIGKLAATLDSEKLKEATRERDFTENALRSAQKRKTALEEKLISLGKLTHTPDEYRSMLNSLDETIDELTLRHEACELAISAIHEAGESMKTGVNLRIARTASELMRSCTPHDNIILDPMLEASLESGSRHLTPDILSKGTADIAYLSVRTALASEMFPLERPITVFDECFAHIDSVRTRDFLRALSGGQYLILTCREDEKATASSLGINIIEL